MVTALKSPRTKRTREKPPKDASVRKATARGLGGLDEADTWEEVCVDNAAVPLDLPFGLDPAEVRCPYCAGRCADDGWQEHGEVESLAEFQDFVDRLLDFDDEGWDGMDGRWYDESEECRTEDVWDTDGEGGQTMDIWDDSEGAWSDDGETDWKKNEAEDLGGTKKRRILA